MRRIQTKLNEKHEKLPEQKIDKREGFEALKGAFDQEVKEYREKEKHKSLERQAIDGDIGFLEYCDKVSKRELPLIDSHRGVRRVKEKTNISKTEFTAIKDGETYICKHCGQIGACETECSDCYAWWSREGKEGRMKGYNGMVREYREKGKHFKEYADRLSRQYCKEKHKKEHIQLMHPSIDPEIDKPIWYCEKCGYSFQGGW